MFVMMAGYDEDIIEVVPHLIVQVGSGTSDRSFRYRHLFRQQLSYLLPETNVSNQVKTFSASKMV